MKKTKITITILSLLTVSLLVSTITLAVYYDKGEKQNKNNKNLIEAAYQKAYYTLIDETNNMEIKLAKLGVTSGYETQLALLSDIEKSAEVSVNALSSLASNDVSITNTTKFINQTGDFANFLCTQLENGKQFTIEQKQSFSKIYDMFVKLGQELSKVSDKINQGYLFLDSTNNANSVLSNIFTELNDSSVEYPTLIYDGPFSDSLNDKEIKGLKGDDINEAKGKEIINRIFEKQNVKIENFLGEWQADIPTLNYEIKLNGKAASCQLSKKGGIIISLNSYREVSYPKLSDDECAEIGRQFLINAGFDDLTPVWICNDNSTVFINYAPSMHGAIIYPDIIKVKVASDNGDIIGVEAVSYAFNHTARQLEKPKLTKAEAKQKLKISENATEGRLCLIPTKTNEEKLCYEFKIQSGGTYYIYINAVTGNEEEVLYVVSTTGGLKLI